MFLDGLELRPVGIKDDRGFGIIGLALGKGPLPLEEPDRHAALRFHRGAIPEVETTLPGLRNEGLLATHYPCRLSKKRRSNSSAG
jgi:hypothetical protein